MRALRARDDNSALRSRSESPLVWILRAGRLAHHRSLRKILNIQMEEAVPKRLPPRRARLALEPLRERADLPNSRRRNIRVAVSRRVSMLGD